MFLIIPFDLYFNSREFWRWDINLPFRFTLAGLVLFFGFSLMLLVIQRVHPRLFRAVSFTLFYIGIFILLADIFSPLQTGLLDGSELTSREPLIHTIIEGGLFVILLFGSIVMRKRAREIGIAVSICLVVICVVYSGIICIYRKPAESVSVSGEGNPAQIEGNVYHILLDELQTDAAMIHLKENGLEKTFDGFTLFEKNMANYLFTDISMPSYLTGTLYKTGDFEQWKTSYQGHGIFKQMIQHGYQIRLYTVYPQWCSPHATSCESLEDIFEKKTGLVNSGFVDFFQIWFARILPNVISNTALREGKRYGKCLYSRISPKDDTIPSSLAGGKAPYSSVLMLKALIDTEKERPANGQYIYAHAIIPHGPYVMNEHCRYDKSMWSTLGAEKAYYQQVKCGLNLVADFIRELKRLKRYKDATIIVHADTGHGHLGFIEKHGDSLVCSAITEGDSPPFFDEKFKKSSLVG